MVNTPYENAGAFQVFLSDRRVSALEKMRLHRPNLSYMSVWQYIKWSLL